MASSNDKASWWQIVKSVTASMFGVQSEKNQRIDFQQSSIVPYVVVAVIFVVLFVVGLAVAINLAVG